MKQDPKVIRAIQTIFPTIDEYDVDERTGRYFICAYGVKIALVSKSDQELIEKEITR